MSELNFASDVLAPMVRGEDLDRVRAQRALGAMLAGDVDPTLTASFLTALTMKGETVDEMTGFVDAMMDASLSADAPAGCVDIVGTGGDQLHSVNVSTMASFAVAGAGVPVAKHGNRSATSSVGSADILESLGINIQADADTVRRSIDESNFGFYFAPAFHPALANLGPVRRSLGFRTIFNVLGPLANPARVQRALIGVAQAHLLAPMSQVLATRGIDRALLVRGDEGLDELSLGTTSAVWTVDRSGVVPETIDAGAVLGRHHGLDALRGGDVGQNRAAFESFLAGTTGPVFDVVCANAGLALVAAGRCATLAEGFDLASAAVRSGAAKQALERAIAATNR